MSNCRLFLFEGFAQRSFYFSVVLLGQAAVWRPKLFTWLAVSSRKLGSIRGFPLNQTVTEICAVQWYLYIKLAELVLCDISQCRVQPVERKYFASRPNEELASVSWGFRYELGCACIDQPQSGMPDCIVGKGGKCFGDEDVCRFADAAGDTLIRYGYVS